MSQRPSDLTTRQALIQAGSDRTLRDVFARIGPRGLACAVRPSRGFGVRTCGDGAPRRVAGRPSRYGLPGTRIVADVGLEFSPSLRVAAQTVTLTNTGRRPSPPLNDLRAVEIPFDVSLRDDPYACGFGGMAGMENTGFYPPPAYRLEEVRFGHAVPDDAVAMNPLRWWSGRRHYELQSGADGRACTPHLPLALFGWRTAGGELGVWLALEWSGRWFIRIESDVDGRFRIAAGPLVRDLALEAGESIRLPRVHVGMFGGRGRNREDGFNSIRRYIREAVAPDVEGKRPAAFLAYDHWMGIHGDITESLLKKQADKAAELGLEYFVVDAGWFAGDRRGWFEAVGNWDRVDRRKFPRGLEPLARHVRARGLRFGMWFEPERAAAGSDWVREHPDWFIRAGDPPLFNLDLTRRPVQDALIAMLSGYVVRLDLRWLRWDYNQAPGRFWDAEDPSGKIQFAYVAGLYRVMDALLERHPRLLLDLGWRMDFGSMRRSATTIMADYAEDPHIVRILQTGGARAIPANYLNGFTYQGKDDALVLSPFALISRMAGSFTLGGHIARYSRRETARLNRYLDGYRSFKHLLTQDVHALTPFPRRPDEDDVVEFCDPRSGEAVILAYGVRGGPRRVRVPVKGLRRGETYRIVDPFRPGSPDTVKGSRLMREGLSLTLGADTAQVRRLVPSPR